MRRLKIRAPSLYRGPFLNPPPPSGEASFLGFSHFAVVVCLFLFVGPMSLPFGT